MPLIASESWVSGRKEIRKSSIHELIVPTQVAKFFLNEIFIKSYRNYGFVGEIITPCRFMIGSSSHSV
jgi:hypothetical protein